MTMKKRIKINGVYLLVPVVCGDGALIAAQYGLTVLAAALGLVALAVFIAGAVRVQVVWRDV